MDFVKYFGNLTLCKYLKLKDLIFCMSHKIYYAKHLSISHLQRFCKIENRLKLLSNQMGFLPADNTNSSSLSESRFKKLIGIFTVSRAWKSFFAGSGMFSLSFTTIVRSVGIPIAVLILPMAKTMGAERPHFEQRNLASWSMYAPDSKSFTSYSILNWGGSFTSGNNGERRFICPGDRHLGLSFAAFNLPSHIPANATINPNNAIRILKMMRGWIADTIENNATNPVDTQKIIQVVTIRVIGIIGFFFSLCMVGYGLINDMNPFRKDK